MTAIVKTPEGRVHGAHASGLEVFLGIPYAAAPSGERRLRPPQLLPPSDGDLDATSFGPMPPQRPDKLSLELGLLADQGVGEDCLRLNLWTPATDRGRRPVMVWIPGGAFATGSGASPWYDGQHLARRGDVVVATVSYRVGSLGFLHLPELGPECANRGLQDQIAALDWVRSHIQLFGGDPDNITVFGESAGAGSIVSLLAMPSARGRFRRAIVQSAAPDGMIDADEATRRGALLLERLGPGSTAATLAQAPLEKLLDAQQACIDAGPHAKGMFFLPVIDGNLLPERPLDAIAGGGARDVDLLIGTTRDELNLFQLQQPEQALPIALVKQIVAAQVPGCDGEGRPWAEVLVAGYQKLLKDTADDGTRLFCAFQTDFAIGYPASVVARTQAAHAAAWLYLFTAESALKAGGGSLGACHALDIPYVFGTLDVDGAREFTGASKEAWVLSEKIMDAWIAFARTGDPSHPGTGNWPACKPESLPTMEFGARVGLIEPGDELLASRAMWDATGLF